jgi:putative ABC transport system substrate-binding protein
VKRREFILGGAAAALPVAAPAQQRAPLVSFLGPNLDAKSPREHFEAFLEELRSLGFADGQNVVVHHQSLSDSRGAVAVGAELSRAKPDVIVALGPESALQMVMPAAQTIPVVLVAINFDPIERGYVSSLAKPSGNITGLIYRQPELAAKQVELLAEAFPGKNKLAVLWDAQTADQFSYAERRATSTRFNVQSIKLERPPYNIEAAFNEIQAQRAEVLLVLSSPSFIPSMGRIAEATMAKSVPAMYTAKQWVATGGLMSYGVDFLAMYRRAANFVAKILKGERAANLPIELPTKFELVVNLKTAKAMGIELPTGILLRADEVIE